MPAGKRPASLVVVPASVRYDPSMPLEVVAELLRLGEADIVDFEARMREVAPAYDVGDRVELYGEGFEVAEVQREGMAGYWLKRPGKDALFLPVDLEGVLRPVVQ
jgi:hypothetical protein